MGKSVENMRLCGKRERARSDAGIDLAPLLYKALQFFSLSFHTHRFLHLFSTPSIRRRNPPNVTAAAAAAAAAKPPPLNTPFRPTPTHPTLFVKEPADLT